MKTKKYLLKSAGEIDFPMQKNSKDGKADPLEGTMADGNNNCGKTTMNQWTSSIVFHFNYITM